MSWRINTRDTHPDSRFSSSEWEWGGPPKVKEPRWEPQGNFVALCKLAAFFITCTALVFALA